MSGNQIGNDGVSYLLRELAKASTVAVLKLDANDITAAAGTYIAEFLINCKSCTTLHLKSNKLSDGGAAKVANALEGKRTVLENLNLTNCELTKTGLFFLLKALRQNHCLINLTLDANSFESTQPFFVIGKLLSSGCRLKKLKARHCNIGDNIGVQFGDHLCKNKFLNTIDLSNNMMTDLSLKSIAISLRQNTGRLEHIKIASNLFSDKEGLRFGEALKHNQYIKTVDLSNNNFTDSSATQMLTVLMR